MSTQTTRQSWFRAARCRVGRVVDRCGMRVVLMAVVSAGGILGWIALSFGDVHVVSVSGKALTIIRFNDYVLTRESRTLRKASRDFLDISFGSKDNAIDVLSQSYVFVGSQSNNYALPITVFALLCICIFVLCAFLIGSRLTSSRGTCPRCRYVLGSHVGEKWVCPECGFEHVSQERSA
jgi:hypothetical protein